MTDEVTPTREQCIEFLKDKCRVYQHAPDGRWYAAILSHLRTPRVEAGDGVSDAKLTLAQNLLVTALEWLRETEPFSTQDLDDWAEHVAALSRRPSEARGDERPQCDNGTCDYAATSNGYHCCVNCGHTRGYRPSEAVDTTRPAPSRRLTGAELPRYELIEAAALAWIEEVSDAYKLDRAYDGKLMAGFKAGVRWMHSHALASEDGAAVGAAPFEALAPKCVIGSLFKFTRNDSVPPDELHVYDNTGRLVLKVTGLDAPPSPAPAVESTTPPTKGAGR